MTDARFETRGERLNIPRGWNSYPSSHFAAVDYEVPSHG